MKLAKAQKIVEMWNEIDDGEMSTEMLFSLVCERFHENINNADVAEALRLVKEHIEKSIQP